jgi:molecular chaperone Hsp33
VHPAQAVAFACPCSMERVLNALKLVGEEELMPIVEANGQIDTKCEFCGKQYAVDRASVLALFAEKNPNAVPGTRTLQ